jgi:hypothetical protein
MFATSFQLDGTTQTGFKLLSKQHNTSDPVI